MTEEEFNRLSFEEQRNLIGVRNEIFSKVLRAGRRIDRLYQLENFYVEYIVSPEENIDIIKAFIMNEESLQTWKLRRYLMQ